MLPQLSFLDLRVSIDRSPSSRAVAPRAQQGASNSYQLTAGGKPSTWLPPGGLGEILDLHFMNFNQKRHIFILFFNLNLKKY